jgi:DNA mismatch endonuclease (patch repair protein)
VSAGKSQKSKDTGPELAMRKALRGVDLRGYRLHHRVSLPAHRGRPQHTTPDIAFVSGKVAIFVDGCWWHTCVLHGGGDTKKNVGEWRQKRALIRARDERHSRFLVIAGWRVFRVWECEDPRAAAKAVRALIDIEATPGVYGLPPP